MTDTKPDKKPDDPTPDDAPSKAQGNAGTTTGSVPNPAVEDPTHPDSTVGRQRRDTIRDVASNVRNAPDKTDEDQTPAPEPTDKPSRP